MTRGFTLIEVMIGAALLAIAVVGLLSTLTAATRLQQTNRETTLAMNGIKDKIEELRNYPFFSDLTNPGGALPLVAHYRQAGNNPATSLPWDTFQLTGLNPAPAFSDANGNGTAEPNEGDPDSDGIVGRIVFFTNETENTPASQRVGLDGTGSALDLNGDNNPNNRTDTTADNDSDGNADYVLVPVTVRVNWRSGSGSREMQVSTLLAKRR